MSRHTPLPRLERLRERLLLKPDGMLVWRAGVRKGFTALHKNRGGYYTIRVDKKSYLCHRIVYLMFYGVDPGQLQVDHKDGNPGNNRPENLRLASQTENNANRGDGSDRSSSGYRNIYRRPGEVAYRVVLWKNRIKYDYGRYKSLDDAIAEAARARQDLFGQFA